MIEDTVRFTANPPAHSPLLVQTTTRPKRAAILFDVEKATGFELDGAMAAATEFWGGAFYPLVPFQGGNIAPNWWRVVEAIDPDIIYSLHPLPQELIKFLLVQSSPLRIFQAPQDSYERKAGRRLVEKHNLNALTTARIPPIVSAERSRTSSQLLHFLVLEDKWTNGANRAFALRNFGVLTKDVRFSRAFDELPSQWLDANAKSPRELLQQFAMGAPITPRDLATVYAPRPFFPEHDDFSTAFWLVLGDSPLDAALAWNSTLSHPEHLGRSALWLSSADLSDADLLAEVRNWIVRCHYPLASQSPGRGFVVSYSEDETRLAALASKAHTGSVRFEHRKLSPEESLFPAVRRPIEPTLNLSRVQQIAVRGQGGRATFVYPPFSTQSFYEGDWMVDLEIEHPRDQSVISNTVPLWRVPRRPGVAHCFSNSQRAIRVNWARIPSVEVRASDGDVRFTVPSARSVFEMCLSETVLLDNGNVSTGAPSQYRLETSDAGLQLEGLIGLFGGLWSAGRAFEDPFWRDVLTELAGRPEDMRTRQVNAVAAALSEEVNKGGGQLSSAQVATAAERIAEKGWRSEPGQRSIVLDKVPARYNKFVAEHAKQRGGQSYFSPDTKFESEARNELEVLIQRAALLQGIQIRCDLCFTNFWRHVDNLRRELACPGCLSTIAFPANPDWSVRLNELVAGAIRERGVIPVLHALYYLLNLPPSSTFTYVASQDLKTYPDEKRIGDFDLLVLMDGKLLVGEVKWHPRGFDEPAVDGAKRMAQIIRPDVLAFVAEGEQWPSQTQGVFDAARTELAGLGVEVRPMLLQW